MASVNRALKAARNNAFWCDAVCRAHGAPGVFFESIWLNRRVTPPFYPNAITLTGEPDSTAQLAHLQDLLQAGIPGEWAVKDSFASLDLAPLGFQVLFEARWIWKPADRRLPVSAETGIVWTVMREPSALARWEAAWNGADDPARGSRVFLPPLLDDPRIAFIAGYEGGKIVAGAVASESEGVVGISNVFTPLDRARSFWAGCVSAAMGCFPGLPLVGYERDEALELALSLGFAALSPLRVWARSTPGG